MKDVGWSDFLLALLLTPVITLPFIGLVYLVLFVLMDIDLGGFQYWHYTTWAVVCVIEGLLFASMYEGRGKAIEHAWAWLLAFAVVPVASVLAYSAGSVSSDAALSYSYLASSQIAGVFLVVMLSIFFSTRRRGIDAAEKRKIEYERQVSYAFLRK